MNIYDKMPMKFIKWAMDNDMELTLEKDCINLNTGMKSGLRLFYEQGLYVAKMRYDETRVISTFWDLYLAVKGCMHGRDFMSGRISKLHDQGFGAIEDDQFE